MVVSEEDARTKWCRFALIPAVLPLGPQGGFPVVVNRSVGPLNAPQVQPGATCLGASCMAWRPVPAKGEKMGYCGADARSDL